METVKEKSAQKRPTKKEVSYKKRHNTLRQKNLRVCSKCGFLIRSINHNEGSHHRNFTL